MNWEVQLIGDATDLQLFADTFTVGEVHVAHSGKEYVLRSAQFEFLDSAASVRESAIELVTALSSSARLVLGAREAIEVGAAVSRRVRPDGEREAITVLVGQAVSHERALPITVVHGTQTREPAYARPRRDVPARVSAAESLQISSHHAATIGRASKGSQLSRNTIHRLGNGATVYGSLRAGVTRCDKESALSCQCVAACSTRV